MIASGKLTDINPEDDSTWRDREFLTFDIDWAHDEILSDTIDLIDRAGVPATWFVTHETPLLERLRANPKYELGIHPNFNWLLKSDIRQGVDPLEVIARLRAFVPEARCVRSHSMAQSNDLLQVFADTGFTHDANHFIPASTGIPLKPWRLWNGMIRVPYNWEDDITCLFQEKGMPATEITEAAQLGGLQVFDFHPIHIFLNTESLSRYHITRSFHQNPQQLIKHRFAGYGTRSRLLKLLELYQTP